MKSSRLATWLEQTWLQCYLDRQLTKEENTWFETYALDKPDLLAAIGVDSTLRDALVVDPQFETGFCVDPPAPQAIDSQDNRGLTGRAHRIVGMKRFRLMHLGVAIVFSLIIGFGMGWYTNRYLAKRISSTVLASPTRIVFDQVHAGSLRPRVEHINRALAYDLVQIALPPGAEKVSLRLGTGQTRALQVGPDGLVGFLMDHNILRTAIDVQVRYSWRNRQMVFPLDFTDISPDQG